jgi:hypothetical protein
MRGAKEKSEEQGQKEEASFSTSSSFKEKHFGASGLGASCFDCDILLL